MATVSDWHGPSAGYMVLEGVLVPLTDANLMDAAHWVNALAASPADVRPKTAAAAGRSASAV